MIKTKNGEFTPDDIPDYANIEKEIEIEEDNPKKKQADLVIEFVQNHYNLIFDENGQVYASDRKTGILQKLNSGVFKDEIRAKFYHVFKSAINDQSLKMAFGTLAGIARRQGEKSAIYMRSAPYQSGYIIDLCQSGNTKCVLVQAGKWQTLKTAPVHFWRPAAMQDLPMPSKGGDIRPLWQVVNVREQERILIIAWLLECFRTDTPFPVLELVAGQGAGKSLTQDSLRQLVDPNSENLRGIPNSTDDLFTVAACNHLLSFENISSLSWQYQDAMCICATGGGYAKRMLYTDSDEIILKAKRPIIANGISAAITRPDLVDRTVSLELEPLSERKDVKKLRADFEANRAAILGGLLDIMTQALKILPRINLPANERPRLVEFAYLGMAVAQTIGLEQASFMEQFNLRRHETVMRTIDASPIATALIDWFEAQNKKERKEPLKFLFREISAHKGQGAENWPKSVKGFGDALRRTAPALMQVGIHVKPLGKIAGNYQWQISAIPNPQKNKVPDTKSSKSPSPERQQQKQDMGTSRTCSPKENIVEGEI